jgi:hypothetical protein
METKEFKAAFPNIFAPQPEELSIKGISELNWYEKMTQEEKDDYNSKTNYGGW